MIRLPIVSDRFYSGNPNQLKQDVLKHLHGSLSSPPSAIAAIVPHAGYIFSGDLAGKTLGGIDIPQSVIILGPNHTGYGVPISLSSKPWQIPTGSVPIHSGLLNALLDKSSIFAVDESAHIQEHSLEVQLPFLLELQPNLSIVPITCSSLSLAECSLAGKTIAEVVQTSDQDVLILASNDMSHFIEKETATLQDQKAINKIMSLDPEGLYQTVKENKISMCGYIPVTIALFAANRLGAGKAELVGYTDSSEINGDTDSVVGYLGCRIKKGSA